MVSDVGLVSLAGEYYLHGYGYAANSPRANAVESGKLTND